MKTLEQQSLFEIVMAVGNGTELSSMLHASLQVIMRKLGCNIGAVMRDVDGSFSVVHAIPRHAANHQGLLSISQHIQQNAIAITIDQPLLLETFDQAFMVFKLPGYGILILGKTGAALTKSVLGALAQIACKLAAACVACEQTQAIKTANEINQRQLDELSSVYQLSQAVSVAESLEHIYVTAKQTILCTLKADKISILLFDSTGVMRFESWQGLSDAYRKVFEGHSPWQPNAVDPEPVFIEDVEIGVSWAQFRAVFATEGIRALGFVPLVHHKRLLGEFMIHYEQPHQFTEDEIRLAKTISFHVAFAIAREQAALILKESNDRFEQIAENIHEAFWMTDVIHDNTLYVSSPYERIWGRPLASLYASSKDWLDAIHAEDKDRIFRALISNQPADLFDEEYRIVRSDGCVRWIHDQAFPVKNNDGLVYRVVHVAEDVTQRKVFEEDIKHLAYYDALTHLPNRRLLQDRLQLAMATSARRHTNGALLFIDLDHFKTLNDTRGHDIGDLLLIEIANRLQNSLRATDTIARLGGDEFVIMLENLSADFQQAAAAAQDVGEQVLALIASPINLKGISYRGSSSIGIGLFCGEQVEMSNLLKHADMAMYQAKAAGRNTLRFFDHDMQNKLEMQVALTNELHQALLQRQFRLYYQPQVVNGRIVGVEALLRWQHPERGLILPGEFIYLAEESGLIVPIGIWVLQTACNQLTAWHANPLTRDLCLALNVSARQFGQQDFVEQVLSVLKDSDINLRSHQLKLELTESMVLQDVDASISKMKALRNMGIKFSLDDFGTGQSSLSYLKRLPLDQIKIDQSFVRDIATDANDAIIVRTIIGMAKSLDLDVIAEGVETQQQREFLEQNDCYNHQGYLYGKPMPMEDLICVLTSQQTMIEPKVTYLLS